MKIPIILYVILCSSVLVYSHIKQHKVLKTKDENCTATEDDESDFPDDLFTLKERQEGAIALHIFCGLYCFIIIAFVCNDYFLPAVDCICQDLNLSKDVAGATFMAFATSAPELFVNVIGTFLTQSDLGVGTVVGSAVFNTLGVAACSGIAAKTIIPLEVWPLARDCSIYALVVVALTGVLWDEKVEWYESLCLLCMYIMYCIVLFCQQKLHKAAKSVINSSKNSMKSNCSTVALACNGEMSTGTYRPFYHHGEAFGWDRHPSSVRQEDVKTVELAHDKKIEHKIEDNEPELKKKSSVLKMLWKAFSYPVVLSLHWTIPDCHLRRSLYPATFLISVLWIGGASYIVSWMMTVAGDTWGVSSSVMGLTFVAMGGSMPEASTSIINARRGIASMTISNALGGNTLDILLSLGLPWFIKSLSSPTFAAVQIHSANLVYNNVAQLACIGVLFVAAALNRFRMELRLGLVCLIMYFLFIIFIVCMDIFNSSGNDC